MEEQEELHPKPSARSPFNLGSCRSFDILRDDLGDFRQDSFHSLFCVAGTQADRPDDNAVAVVHMSNVRGQRCNHRRPALAEDVRDRNFKAESINGKQDQASESRQPLLQVQFVAHEGYINRVRAMNQQSHIIATWADSGSIQVWDMGAHIRVLSTGGPCVPGSHRRLHQAPLCTYTGHVDKGFALDWSPLIAGRLLSGDCKSAIHLWEPTTAGQWVVEKDPFLGHAGSVEDLQWSPTEAAVFASCSGDGSLRIWDTRHRQDSTVSVNAHSAAVNGISWNSLESCVIASGCNNGTVRIWDLRILKDDAFVAEVNYHKGPITSIEWSPHKASALSVISADHHLTIWDLSSSTGTEGTIHISQQHAKVSNNSSAQLLLEVHQTSGTLKESHWHPQIEGMLISADGVSYLDKDCFTCKHQQKGWHLELARDEEAISEADRPSVGLPERTDSLKDEGMNAACLGMEVNIGIQLVLSNEKTSQSFSEDLCGKRKSLGRPRRILEPEHLRGVSKECPRCNSTDTKFQYFNNNKETQPRYKCGSCETKFTYNGRVMKNASSLSRKAKEPVVTKSTETLTEIRQAKLVMLSDLEKLQNEILEDPPDIDSSRGLFSKISFQIHKNDGKGEQSKGDPLLGNNSDDVSKPRQLEQEQEASKELLNCNNACTTLFNKETSAHAGCGVEMKNALGRRRKRMEPEHLRGVSKECPYCHSHDTKFQYFNNNKESQPRYKCANCSIKFTYNGRINKKSRCWLPDPANTTSTLSEAIQEDFIASTDGPKGLEERQWLPHLQGILSSSDRRLMHLGATQLNQNGVLGETESQFNAPNLLDLGGNETRFTCSCLSVAENAIASTPSKQDTHEVPSNGTGLRRVRRKISEPEDLRGISKECPHCSSHDTKFQYFNNNKESQPRYKCKNCGTKFTYKGRVNKKIPSRPSGVGKSFLCNLEAHQEAPVVPRDVIELNDQSGGFLSKLETTTSPGCLQTLIPSNGSQRNPRVGDLRVEQDGARDGEGCAQDGAQLEYQQAEELQELNSDHRHFETEGRLVSNKRLITEPDMDEASTIDALSGMEKRRSATSTMDIRFSTLSVSMDTSECSPNRPEHGADVLTCRVEMKRILGRPRKVMEPEHLRGLTKACPHCHSNSTNFQYFNNKKQSQPRYKCENCATKFTYYGDVHENSKRGSLDMHELVSQSSNTACARASPAEPNISTSVLQIPPLEARAAGFEVGPMNNIVCCPRCPSSRTRFLYFNNGKRSQPRYKCVECKSTFTHGGRIRQQAVNTHNFDPTNAGNFQKAQGEAG